MQLFDSQQIDGKYSTVIMLSQLPCEIFSQWFCFYVVPRCCNVSPCQSVYFDTTDAVWRIPSSEHARSVLHITHTEPQNISIFQSKWIACPDCENGKYCGKSTKIEFAPTKPAMFSSFPEAWVVLFYCRLPFRRKHNNVGKPTNLQHHKSTHLEKSNCIRIGIKSNINVLVLQPVVFQWYQQQA